MKGSRIARHLQYLYPLSGEIQVPKAFHKYTNFTGAKNDFIKILLRENTNKTSVK